MDLKVQALKAKYQAEKLAAIATLEVLESANTRRLSKKWLNL